MSQLQWHVDAALHLGAQPSEVEEIRRIAASYAGDAAASGHAPPALHDITRELATVALLTALGTQPVALNRRRFNQSHN